MRREELFNSSGCYRSLLDINPDQIELAASLFTFPANVGSVRILEGNAWDPGFKGICGDYDLILSGMNPDCPNSRHWLSGYALPGFGWNEPVHWGDGLAGSPDNPDVRRDLIGTGRRWGQRTSGISFPVNSGRCGTRVRRSYSASMLDQEQSSHTVAVTAVITTSTATSTGPNG